MVLLATVWQTGANYAMKHLVPGCLHHHCGDPALDTDAAASLPWVTTYRDPYLVGASWANRYAWKEVRDEWVRQWRSYQTQVLPRAQRVFRVDEYVHAPMKSAPDKTGAKGLYEVGDMAEYFKLVPQDLIEIALDATREI